MSTAMRTRDELQEELAGARRRHQDALAEAGLARVGGSVDAKVTKDVTATQIEVAELEAALDAFDRVEGQQRQSAEREAARDGRIALYEWVDGYIPLLDEMVEARSVLEAVEQKIRDSFAACPRRGLLTTRRERRVVDGNRRDMHIEETDIDPMITAIPVPAQQGGKPRDFNWSEENGERLSAVFRELIETEREESADAQA